MEQLLTHLLCDHFMIPIGNGVINGLNSFPEFFFIHLFFPFSKMATGTIPQRQSKVYHKLINKGDILHLDMKICDILI
mgnify:CR=1 FL=1